MLTPSPVGFACTPRVRVEHAYWGGPSAAFLDAASSFGREECGFSITMPRLKLPSELSGH